MLEASSLIVCPVIVPLTAGLLCFLSRRTAFFASLSACLANLVGVCLLLGRSLSGPASYHVGGWQAPLGITLRIDGPSLLMLLMTAVTGLGITLYARGYFSFRIFFPKRIARHERQERFFWPLWMLLLAALNALFLSADIFNWYVTLEMVSVSAAALAALSGKPASQIAAFRYLLVSLLGSLSYLLGVVFVYKVHGVLDLNMLRACAGGGEGMHLALALMSVGLMLKTALFPMHFWLPPAHANALAPVSAILSGLVVKGSFYILFRLWFDVFPTCVSPAALNLVGILGAGAILWGSVQAIRQQRLKLLVAYSTVSQLGYLFIAFPLAYLQNDGLWSAVIFMALAHSCAKSAMFMASGTIFLHFGHDRINDLAGTRKCLPVTAFAYAIAGVNLMGLPPSGGFIAKWLLLSSSLASSRWWWGIVVMVGSLLSSVYVFRVVSRLFVVPEDLPVRQCLPRSPLLEWPALVLALIALLLGLVAPYPLAVLDAGRISLMLSGGGGP